MGAISDNPHGNIPPPVVPGGGSVSGVPAAQFVKHHVGIDVVERADGSMTILPESGPQLAPPVNAPFQPGSNSFLKGPKLAVSLMIALTMAAESGKFEMLMASQMKSNNLELLYETAKETANQIRISHDAQAQEHRDTAYKAFFTAGAQLLGGVALIAGSIKNKPEFGRGLSDGMQGMANIAGGVIELDIAEQKLIEGLASAQQQYLQEQMQMFTKMLDANSEAYASGQKSFEQFLQTLTQILRDIVQLANITRA